MSRSIRISETMAKRIGYVLKAAAIAGVWPPSVSVYCGLDDLMRVLEPQPKKFVRLAAKRKRAKKASKREETAEIRAAVFERAKGACECGCSLTLWPPSSGLRGAEMDHFYPKGRTPQTVKTCWALTAECHSLKTRNWPSSGYWLKRFIAHCDRHGYTSEASRARRRLESLEAIEQTEKLSQKNLASDTEHGCPQTQGQLK